MATTCQSPYSWEHGPCVVPVEDFKTLNTQDIVLALPKEYMVGMTAEEITNYMSHALAEWNSGKSENDQVTETNFLADMAWELKLSWAQRDKVEQDIEALKVKSQPGSDLTE